MGRSRGLPGPLRKPHGSAAKRPLKFECVRHGVTCLRWLTVSAQAEIHAAPEEGNVTLNVRPVGEKPATHHQVCAQYKE